MLRPFGAPAGTSLLPEAPVGARGPAASADTSGRGCGESGDGRWSRRVPPGGAVGGLGPWAPPEHRGQGRTGLGAS